MIAPVTAILMSISGLAQAIQFTETRIPAGGGTIPAWNVPFNLVSRGMLDNLKVFLLTDTGKGLLSRYPSMTTFQTLKPESEAHRRIVGALGLPPDFETQLAEAIEPGNPRELEGVLSTLVSVYPTAEKTIMSSVQSRADEISAAFNQNGQEAMPLSKAASELAPFTSISQAAKAVTAMAGTMNSENTFAIEAMKMMARAGKDMRPSIGNLRSFSNQLQLDALQSLIDNDYQIYDKLPAIVSFDNEHQVSALKAMVENGRDILPALGEIVKFDNAHQAAAVGRLAPTEYRISDKIGDITRINGPIPVEAIGAMIEHHRALKPSMSSLVLFSNDIQLDALRILLSSKIYYQISDKVAALLEWTRKEQAESLALLVNKALPVNWLLPALQMVESVDHEDLISGIAANIVKPVYRPGIMGRIAGWAANIPSSALFAILLAAAGYWPIGLGILGAAYAGRRILRHFAQQAKQSMREANRKWLDAYPLIEKAFGKLDDPEMFSERAQN